MSPIIRLLTTLAQATKQVTSREVADAVGIDYRKNFNKREAKYARKIARFLVRGRLQDTDAPKVIHWSLTDEWKNVAVSDLIAAYRKGARV